MLFFEWYNGRLHPRAIATGQILPGTHNAENIAEVTASGSFFLLGTTMAITTYRHTLILFREATVHHNRMPALYNMLQIHYTPAAPSNYSFPQPNTKKNFGRGLGLTAEPCLNFWPIIGPSIVF